MRSIEELAGEIRAGRCRPFFKEVPKSGAGGTLAARLTTPVLVARIVRIVGLRLTTMEAARLVPIAGQLIAAGIGYWSINTVAMRHIAHCERLMSELQAPGAGNRACPRPFAPS